MANSNEGQDHKDTYFDTSRKILSQEMTVCNMEALVSYYLEVLTNVNSFFKLVKCQSQKIKYHKKISSQGIFIWNIKALALTIQKWFAS